MPELFQKMYYGPNVQNLVESDDCKVMRLSDNSGEGMMTLYHVFPGVFLMYNDFHMKECISGFQTDMDLLCIDHCREGRIEQEVGQNAFSYLEAGDLRVDRRIHHSGKVEFPLSHYHGISIGFQMETAAKEIPASMKDFSVDLYELQKKYCSDRTPYVIPGEPAIEHIFSELYNVPVKIKKDYFKIKVLELLLYLDALELSGHTEERPYFYKGQIEKIKAFITLKNSHNDIEGIKKEIMDLCKEYLAKWSVPREIEIREELPLTRIGKVDWMQLKQEYGEVV